MNEKEMRKHLSDSVLPRLDMVMDAAAAFVKAHREKEAGFAEEPSFHDCAVVATLILQMISQSGREGYEKALERIKELESALPPHVDLRSIAPVWKEILEENDHEPKEWAHIEDLLVNTAQGQAMLAALFWAALARNQKQGVPPEA